MKTTQQVKTWVSDFGKAYTNRWNIPITEVNKKSNEIFGITTTNLFKDFLRHLKIKTLLEVGCNAGRKLEIISKIDNYSLYGIDPQKYALQKARRRLPYVNFIEGTVFNLPFKDSFFDLVFTYEVLIHISPKNLTNALQEIYRVSRKYILHMEYYSTKLTEVNYRGLTNILWKQDFEKLYLKQFPKLKVVKRRVFEWNESIYGKKGLYSKIFLLSK